MLDWLAVEFRESGWDVKKFFKLMVTSATYRQAAVVTTEKLEKDPDNRCSRAARGSAWTPRWSATTPWPPAACSSKKIGGPSVKPYQPPGVWEAVAMIGSNTRDYKQDTGENLYRRSMYTFWKRAAPPASMDIFNAPNRETCTVRRERTNTPLQALVTLNDPQFVEAARHLAATRDRIGGDDDGSPNRFHRRTAAGPPIRPEELAIVHGSLTKSSKSTTRHKPDDARISPPRPSRSSICTWSAGRRRWTCTTTSRR